MHRGVLMSTYNTCVRTYFTSLSADDFRLFCGDLGNEVSDQTLAKTFSRYKSFAKAKGACVGTSAELFASGRDLWVRNWSDT